MTVIPSSIILRYFVSYLTMFWKLTFQLALIVHPFYRQSSYILEMSMYPVLFFVRLNQIELIIDIMTCKFEKPSLWPKF